LRKPHHGNRLGIEVGRVKHDEVALRATGSKAKSARYPPSSPLAVRGMKHASPAIRLPRSRRTMLPLGPGPASPAAAAHATGALQARRIISVGIDGLRDVDAVDFMLGQGARAGQAYIGRGVRGMSAAPSKRIFLAARFRQAHQRVIAPLWQRGPIDW
jgi:hypothetical protein